MMPDICMCKDEDCPSRKSCYRFMAIRSSPLQSYFYGSPRKDKSDEKCSCFWELDKNERRIRNDES